jgi:hypothetical protein
MMNRVPMDTVIFLTLGAACISRLDRTSSALLIVLLGAYAALELVSSPIGHGMSAAFVLRLKLALAALAISLVVILPTISGMVLRHASEPWSYVHDAAMQVEEAIRFLLQGRNPYAENYLETPLAQWEYAFPPPEVNPALYHNAYLPFIFLFSAPFYACSTWLTGWYDQRLVFLLLFAVACWLYMQHGRSITRRLSLLIVFGLNFFGVSYVIWGGTDVFVFFWLIACTYLLSRNRTTAAAVCLGLACASKQTAWLFVPFFLIHALQKERSSGTWALLGATAPVVLVPALFILPFLLWDAASFVDDTYLYLSGQSASSYPIVGLGFGGMLVDLGFVRDKNAYFPFILFQLAFSIPLLIFSLRRQWRRSTVQRCWFGYGLLLLCFTFFSRFFSDFYLGTIVNALVLGCLCEGGQAETDGPEHG